jgi:cysteine-S-conjugate beta-lyase
MRVCAVGEHVVAGDDIYGGTSRLLDQVLPALGVEVANVDHTDLNAFKRAFVPGRTKLVLLESPTNPRMRVRPFTTVHARCCVQHTAAHCAVCLRR